MEPFVFDFVLMDKAVYETPPNWPLVIRAGIFLNIHQNWFPQLAPSDAILKWARNVKFNKQQKSCGIYTNQWTPCIALEWCPLFRESID